jgi:signal peptidase I
MLARGNEGATGRRGPLVDALILIAAVLGAALLIRGFVLDSYRVPTGSMEPTLLPGDVVLVSKLAYGAHTPDVFPFLPRLRLPALSGLRRGDVVAVRFSDGVIDPDGKSRVFIKRCVALPGDTVSITGGDVRVNPGPADSNRIIVPARGFRIPLTRGTIDGWKDLIVSEGHEVAVSAAGDILIDGAERSHYTVEHDYLYLLGDNRAGSRDSRDWGPVREEFLIGKVAIIFWSSDPGSTDQRSADRRSADSGPGSVAARLSAIRWGRIGRLVR